MAIFTIFLMMMFLAYNYLIFKLLDAILENPRLTPVYRIPVGIMNVLVVIIMVVFIEISSFSAYIIACVLLFIEFVVFYKDKLLCSLFCMLACIIHIMAVRALVVCIFAIVMDTTVYYILHDSLLLVVSTIATFASLNIMICFTIKFIPIQGMRIINQRSEVLGFVTALLAIFSIYLIVNAKVYAISNVTSDFLISQLAVPITVLIGTHIILFFAINMCKLLGYKDKSKELQFAVEKERKYRTAIDKDVVRIIEINFSKNELISGFEDYENQLGNMVHNYGKMIAFMINTTVHGEDSVELAKYTSPQAIISEFDQGTTEISLDYRQLLPEGKYEWMRALVAIMEDGATGDIKGFMQIKNINDEKIQQLELEYKAERDLLTGIYNKITAEKMVSEFLVANQVNPVEGVLFIIDIDNFKTINDRLGHMYGDAVISELSESLQAIFRKHDIIGRIGGDEFLAFVKGPISHSSIREKAAAICKAFLRTYANEYHEGYTVSGSIGIAVFPQDGATFNVLFKCADSALYTAKARGKNGYSFYNKALELPYVSARTAIDTNGVVQKNLKNNHIEYVFRLLYGSEDTKSAVESVLELIAKNFGFSRANIFQFNEFSTSFSSVFEWRANGIDSLTNNQQDMPFDFIISALEKSGGIFTASPVDFPKYMQESYPSDVKSLVHFSIKERDKFIGVIIFQNCTDESFELFDTELEELRIISQVLSIFMSKQLSNERELRRHLAIETIIDNMNSIVYVVDSETYEVFYENKTAASLTGNKAIGTKCHSSYRGSDVPCPDCPLHHMSETNSKCVVELYIKKFAIYTKTSATLFDWPNGRKVLLLSSADITEYKRSAD